MDGMLSRLSGGQIIAMTAIVGTLVLFGSIMLSAIIAPQWRRVRQLEAETRLKHDLLAAGWPAEEIVQVVQASSTVPPSVLRARARDVCSVRK